MRDMTGRQGSREGMRKAKRGKRKETAHKNRKWDLRERVKEKKKSH